MGWLVLLALVVLVVLGEPLFVILGTIATLCYVVFAGYGSLDQLTIFIEKIFELTDKNVLLAIPFFVMSGGIMAEGGIAQKLVNVAKSVVGWMPGGLAISTVMACMFFAAISGSSPVTVIAIGGMMYPALRKENYREAFGLGLVTSAGSLGILIPPSIPMIVYAIVITGTVSVNVGDLFLAGIGPGLLIGGLLGLLCIVEGVKGDNPRQRFSFGEVVFAFKDGFWALMLPVVVLGGIYSGLFTPTEAAAVSVLYAVVVELFIHRELKIPKLGPLFADSAMMMGTLMLIFVIAFGLNDFLVLEKVPDAMVQWIQEQQFTPVVFLLVLNIFLLIVGCLMDILSAILIIAPLLAPMAKAMGLDPIHLGIVFIVNLELGYLTPPLGINLFVSASLFKVSVGQVFKAVVPFTLIMLVGVGIVTYVPTVSLGLGNWLRGEPIWVSLPDGAPPPKAAPAAEPDDDDDDLGDDEGTKAPAGGGGVKSLQELMAEDDDDGDDDDGDGSDRGGVKSLQELMEESDDADDDDAAEEAPADDGKVKSLQELMQEADDDEDDPE